MPHGLELAALDLLPTRPDWAGGLRQAWQPGEDGARQRLAAFVRRGLKGYGAGRDRPDRAGTSMLSPHLHFGEISPGTAWTAVDGAGAADPALAADAEAYLRELGWREFSYQLLFHHDDLADAALRPEYGAFPGATTRPASPRGSAAAPDIPSSMPACASSGRPDGCTTGCGWSPRRS